MKRKLAIAAITGAMMLSSVMPAFAAELPAGAVPDTHKLIDVQEDEESGAITGTGSSETMFEVTNEEMDKDKDPDVLGGDLIISVPAELRLVLMEDKDSEGNGLGTYSYLTKADDVYAVGRTKVSQYLDVKAPTDITYIADDAVTQDQKDESAVPGVVKFGITDTDGDQKETWNAKELVAGVGKESVTDGTGKEISSTVQKEDIKYIGSYTATIDYNATLLGGTADEGYEEVEQP